MDLEKPSNGPPMQLNCLLFRPFREPPTSLRTGLKASATPKDARLIPKELVLMKADPGDLHTLKFR